MNRPGYVLPLFLSYGLLSSCVSTGGEDQSIQTLAKESESIKLGRATSLRLSRSIEKKPVLKTVVLSNGDVFTFEDINGLAVQDDMIWGETSDFINPDGTTNRSASTSTLARKWTTLTIPYYIDPNYPANSPMRGIINDAIKHWEELTVFRFVKVDPNAADFNNRKQYLFFVDKKFHPTDPSKDDLVCSSPVGHFPTVGKQIITLSPGGCLTYQAIHEIGHSLGLRHEHARFDRNEEINVFYNRIGLKKPPVEHNFDAPAESFLPIAFDIKSRMLYGPNDFINQTDRVTGQKIDPRKQHVLTVKDGTAEGALYVKNTTGLSEGDIETIGELYGFAKPPRVKNLIKSLGGCLTPSAEIPAEASIQKPFVDANWVRPKSVPTGSPFIDTQAVIAKCANKSPAIKDPELRFKWQAAEDGTLRGYAGKCLSIKNQGARESIVVLALCPKDGLAIATNLKWTIDSQKGAILASDGKCLSVRNDVTAVNTPLQVKACRRAIEKGQKWSVEKIEPYMPTPGSDAPSLPTASH
ncbi:MAG: hypothetical protein EOP04_01885 [Proteobacteria bacterium]|nr:MAG: hypothetical protein EOP04_01885 [Pseudomonadota bacterium]